MIRKITNYLAESQRTAFQLKKLAFDQRAATELLRFDVGYLPWTSSALAPSALTQVLNDITINKRKHVIELGAGISTIYLGICVKSSGGHLNTLEHDASWAQIIEDLVAANGLNHCVSIHYAPLEKVVVDDVDYDWCSTRVLEEVAKANSVDLLLVDGPPAYQKGKELARYPALPILYPYLSDSCSIFLDDIGRPGEREIVMRWSDFSGIKFSLHELRGGIARGCRGASFNTV